MLALDLQMFSEGGGGEGAPAAGAAAPGADFQADAALEQYRQKRFPGKKQAQAAVTQAVKPTAPEPDSASPAPSEDQPDPQPADRKQAFRDLIKGDYKAEAGEWVEGLIKERFKNQRDAEGELGKIQPLLEALYQKNGVEKGNLDALVHKVTSDDALYEEEALEKGIPIETLKEMKQVQRQAEALKAQADQAQERQLFERHLQGLYQQGEQIKQLYPNFNLREELQNPEFARLTSPNVGVDVRTAFEVVHRDQLEPMRAAAITRKVSEDMSRAYLSGSKRPAENGVSGGSVAVPLSDDPSQWDKNTLRRIINDVKGGKKYRL